MSTTNVQCSFLLNTGEIVSMKGNGTDATLTEIKTSGSTYLSAGGGVQETSLGTFANGKTITAVIQPVTPTTDGEVVLYAFISRRGAIAHIIPTAGFETTSKPWPMSFTLQAGDNLSVMTAETGGTTDDRVQYHCVTSQGTHAIFNATPGTASGGATNLTHVLSGQGLGSSLTGQKIVMHWATCPAPAGLAAAQINNSVFLVNDRGLAQGATIIISPDLLQPVPNNIGMVTPMLNWQAQIIDI